MSTISRYSLSNQHGQNLSSRICCHGSYRRTQQNHDVALANSRRSPSSTTNYTNAASKRCIDWKYDKAILLDIHGVCGHHVICRALVTKALRARLYWPTAMWEAEEIVRKCPGCQKFTTKPHATASELKIIPITLPFAQWGLDMVGAKKQRNRFRWDQHSWIE